MRDRLELPRTRRTLTPRVAALALALGAACGPAEGSDASASAGSTSSTGSTATATSITGATSITTATTATTTTTTDASGSESEGSSGDVDKYDLGDDVPLPGCDSVDILFVIDNSASMGTYQAALADAFPGFVDAMFANLPKGVDLHVGVTTTDFFCSGCNCPDSTVGCQSGADLETIEMYYQKPTDGDDGVNGSQGRLFEHGGKVFFETNTDADPTPLKNWFTATAKAAGEDGCSFEMPVAAASYMAHPANDATNGGFLRDEDSVLLIVLLTDEPDKSPEPLTAYRQFLLDAKAGCGGDECILVAGLVPPCIVDINQKLWQFMTAFGEAPIYGDIKDTKKYSEVVGAALASTLQDTCDNIPQG
ncbi:MAG: hypothetical protein R3B09_29780 [Nannocystaceae bacterium]